MKQLLAISLCLLALASCNHKRDTTDSGCGDSVLNPVTAPEGDSDEHKRHKWKWQDVLDGTNPQFPNYPNPRYMEFFLKSNGCYYNEDTLNILLSTDASIDGLPETICGIPTRYFKHWDDVFKFFGERIIGVEILDLGYEIRSDFDDNPHVFIGVYNRQKFGPEDGDWGSCHDFAEQDYIDSVMNFSRTR